MRSARNILIVILVLSFSTLVGAGLYAQKILNSVEVAKIKSGETKNDREQIKFEAGSVVKKDSFKEFLLFSNRSKTFEGWKKEFSKDYELEKNKIVFKKDIYIEDIFKNDCKQRYCYQHRLNFENIPSVFWKGLIGVEDIRFLDHIGIDFKSILRALIADIKEMKKVQGGSTLTQQIVKNLFFTNDKKLSRKIKEAIVAIYIEWKFSKEDILEAYFNEVFWGTLEGVNVKGIYAASIFYFQKTPNEISPYEASILIGLLKGPNYYHPIRRTERLRKRADLVFNKLISLNLFSMIDAKKWTDIDWNTWIDKLKKRSEKKTFYSLWWTSNEEVTKPINSFQKNILKVKSLELLNLKKEEMKEDLAMKLVIGDGKDFYSFYSKYERDKLTAMSLEKHQIGSTIKPIIYSIIRSLGQKWDDEISTDEIPLKLKSGTWSPKDSSKAKKDFVTMREALQKSINRPLIRMSEARGFDKIEEVLESYIPELKKPLSEYPSQILGAIELSPIDLYSVYLKFVENECRLVSTGKIQWEDSVLFTLSDPNKTTIRNQLNESLKGMTFFGKTGTSNNGNDSWFTFFDGKHVGIIWFGNEGPRDGKNLKLYGSTTSFRIMREFLTLGGKRVNEFSCPEML